MTEHKLTLFQVALNDIELLKTQIHELAQAWINEAHNVQSVSCDGSIQADCLIACANQLNRILRV